MKYPIAIAISDLHLTLTVPSCRAESSDRWMATQAGYLKQVKDIAGKFSRITESIDDLSTVALPVLCSGDIFDKWKAEPELINFALQHLPDGMICIPGQHDLPNHSYDLVHRSGYGVLKQTGKIRDISNNSTGNMGGFSIHGFGWGEDIQPAKPLNNFLRIALIHKYCWIDERSYPGAPEENKLSSFKKVLEGYDIAIFGDNHKGFLVDTKAGCKVLNCGGFIRRKSDEIDYVPKVGIIYSDGTIVRQKLDTSGDRFETILPGRKETPFNMKDFISQLEGLGEHGLDFREAIKQHLENDDIHEKTKEIIWLALEDKN